MYLHVSGVWMVNVGNVGFGAMQIIVFERKENTSCQLNKITTGKRDCWIFYITTRYQIYRQIIFRF